MVKTGEGGGEGGDGVVRTAVKGTGGGERQGLGAAEGPNAGGEW